MRSIQFDMVRVTRLGDQVADHTGYTRSGRSQQIVTERVDWAEA